DTIAANAGLKRVGEAGIDDLRETAELLSDRLGFLDERLQDAVLWPLRVDEIVAEYLGLVLEFSVDAAISLLHAAWIPRHIEVKEVPAMRLKIQAFACRVRGNKNAHWMATGVRIECLLDLFSFVRRGRAMINGDSLIRAVGAFDRARNLLLQVALGVVIFRE